MRSAGSCVARVPVIQPRRVTLLLPGVSDAADADACLAGYRIEERWRTDNELPRQPWQRIRHVRIKGPETDLTLELDPWCLPRC
jgi:hypothetical protein